MVFSFHTVSLITTFLMSTIVLDAAEVTITWETCVENSTIVTKKEACYILDRESSESIYVFKLCAGVNASSGTIVFGGSASSMLCATVTVEAGDEKEAIATAKSRLQKELDKPSVKKDAQRSLNVYSIQHIGKYDLFLPTRKINDSLWKEIERLDTNPFP